MIGIGLMKIDFDSLRYYDTEASKEKKVRGQRYIVTHTASHGHALVRAHLTRVRGSSEVVGNTSSIELSLEGAVGGGGLHVVVSTNVLLGDVDIWDGSLA